MILFILLIVGLVLIIVDTGFDIRWLGFVGVLCLVTVVILAFIDVFGYADVV